MSAVTGFKNPTNTAVNSGVTTPDNGWVDDAAYAVFDNLNDVVYYNIFGDFSIPGGATVLGVQIVLNIKYTGAGVNRDVTVRYSVNGGTNWSSQKSSSVPNTTDTDLTFGADGDTWGLSSLTDTNFDNNNNLHVEVGLAGFSVTSIDLDAVSMRVYYDISHTSTFTADAIVKTIVTKTFTADAIVVPTIQRYSKGDVTPLPSNNDTELENMFADVNYTAVATSDDSRDTQSATGQATIFLFKDKNTDATKAIRPTVELQSTIAPSVVPVILEIFNRNSGLWEELDRDNTTAADTDFTLTGNQSTNLSNYYDANFWVSCRVYQDFS